MDPAPAPHPAQKHFHYLLQRFEVFCRDVIDPAVHPQSHPLEVEAFQCAEPVPFAEAAKAAFQPVRVGWEWGPVWSTCWFRIRGQTPGSMAGKTVALRFSSDTEALLWAPTPGTPRGGTPVHGLDANRDAVRLFGPPPLSAPCRGGEPIELYVEAACNHLFGDRGLQWDPPEIHRRWNSPTPGRLDRCELAVIDEHVWRLKWVYTFALQLARELPHDTARARELFGALRRCTNAIPDDRVSEMAATACAELEAVVRRRAGGSATIAHAVGHAHIDTAWLWPIRETKRKCLRTFASTLRNMERFPDYRFLCSQAQQYAWLEERSPELFTQVKQRVKEGRWEPGGAMWIEPDCHAPSGESLIRQILHADRYWRDRFGDERGRQRFLYLPDTFGFPAQLPQIMRLAGLDTFITNKLHWNDTNTFPHTTFIWRGLDGSEVLGHNTPGMDYNATNTPRELIRGERTHKNKDLPSTEGGEGDEGGGSARWLQPFGFGDGGGGPTDWNILNAQLASDSDALPRVRFSSVGEFCEALHNDVAAARQRDPASVPVHEGELYLELHRGTLTTHARIKQANAECEELLRQAEILTFAGPTRLPADEEKKAKAELDRAWKLLLLNQFHDILPGSSIGWVYEDAQRDYAEVRRVAEGLIEQGVRRWAAVVPARGMKQPVAVFNPSSQGVLDATLIIKRRRIIESEGLTVLMHDAAGTLAKSEANSRSVQAGDLVLESPSQELRVEFDRCGRITSYIAGGDVECCDPRRPMGQMMLYADRPRLWDAWDFDAEHVESASPLDRPADRVEVLERGPVTAAIRFEHRLGRASTLALTFRLSSQSPVLTIEGELDWRERHALLRMLVPAAYTSPLVTLGTQFGHADHHGCDRFKDRAEFERPAHRFASAPLGHWRIGRLAVLLDRLRGVSYRDRTIGVTLLRSPTYPDPEADQGRQVFRLGLVAASLQPEPIVAMAEAFQRPPRVFPLGTPQSKSAAKPRPGAWSPVKIASYPQHVEIECLKPGRRAGELILRLSERAGRSGDVAVNWQIPVKSVSTVDLLEHRTEVPGFAHDSAAKQSSFRIAPFQIVTLSAVRAD